MFLTDPQGDKPLREPQLPHTLDVPAQQLLKAAALIEEMGWCQHRAQGGNGICAIMAITEACGLGSHYQAYWRMRKAVGPVSIWNDHRGRTKEEVVAKLRAVALGG